MVQSSTSALVLVDDVETIDGFDVAEFRLDLRVIEAAHPIAKLTCDTSDGCGNTCSGSACNTNANNPS